MENTNKKKGLDISARSFLIAIGVLAALMVITYILTLVIPGGAYQRTTDANGNTVIDVAAGFAFTEGGISFLKWIASPILVLGAEGNGTLIAVILFLIVIGGIFNCLDKCGLMEYMLAKIIHHYGDKRYTLLAVITAFFLGMGAFVGSFEECVPLVPIVVSLAVGLGWDKETGLGMSLIAVGCGFASGVLNPFTVGVAQKLAGVPMFSGMWLRLVSGILIYLLLWLFLRQHAKKVEKPIAQQVTDNFEKKDELEKALKAFAIILAGGMLLILSSTVITALQDFTMIIVVLMFLAAGITSAALAKMGSRRFLTVFKDGLVSILPAILMILMASSIKYILVEGSILDTILYYSVSAAQNMPKGAVILFLYLIALVLNFFVSSGSAEAILLMPLMVPLAQICGLSANLCVLAFAYGDGFSNVFYPTNAVLLISLGLVDMNYGKYVKWCWKFQALNLLLTGAVLLLGLAVGY